MAFMHKSIYRGVNMEELIIAIENLSNKTLFDYFISFAPLILSMVAIYISIDSTRKQNKIALLDKRIEIYNNLKICISNVIVEGRVTVQNANVFLVKSRDVKFLFGSEIEKLCNKIYKDMLKLKLVGTKVDAGINGRGNVGDHIENCDNESMLMDKMIEYSKVLEEAFSPYISIKKTNI